MLVSTHFIAALLGGFRCQQIVNQRLFRVIGIFRHQLLNLLIIAFRKLQQRLFCLLARATTLTAHKPAAGMRAGTEDPTQQPLQCKEDHQRQHQHDRKTRDAGFNVVVIGLDQHITLMPGEHRAKHDSGEKQCKEQ